MADEEYIMTSDSESEQSVESEFMISSVPKKKKKYHQKYKKLWETEKVFKGWLTNSTLGEGYALCKICSIDVDIKAGRVQVLRHAKTAKHASNAMSTNAGIFEDDESSEPPPRPTLLELASVDSIIPVDRNSVNNNEDESNNIHKIKRDKNIKKKRNLSKSAKKVKMPPTNDRYSLCWSSYNDNLAKGFLDMYSNGYMTDVTLATDGHVLSAHRMVLSVCSPFFKRMLDATPAGNHPIIHLSIPINVLTDLLHYMYCGEIQVSKAKLSEFITFAEQLQIKGLSKVSNAQKFTPPKPKLNVGLKRKVDTSSKTEVPTQLNKKPCKADSSQDSAVPAPTTSSNDVSLEPVPVNVKIDLDEPSETWHTCIDENNLSYSIKIDDAAFTASPESPKNTDISAEGEGLSEHKYLRSQKNNAQLVYDSFIYNKKKTLLAGGTTWRCVDAHKLKCQAVCTTQGNTFMKQRHEHNHENHWDRILNRPLYSTESEAT